MEPEPVAEPLRVSPTVGDQDLRDNRGMATLESVHRASVCRCGCCGVGGGGGEEQVHHVGRRSPPPSLAELASGETENAVLIASLTAGHRIEPLGRSSRSRHARLPREKQTRKLYKRATAVMRPAGELASLLEQLFRVAASKCA